MRAMHDIKDGANVNVAYEAVTTAMQEMKPLSVVERLYAKYVLARRGGNKVHASLTIKIDRRTIQRWESEEKRAVAEEYIKTEGAVQAPAFG